MADLGPRVSAGPVGPTASAAATLRPYLLSTFTMFTTVTRCCSFGLLAVFRLPKSFWGQSTQLVHDRHTCAFCVFSVMAKNLGNLLRSASWMPRSSNFSKDHIVGFD